MKEYIGECNQCSDKVYCENGFLNGVHERNKLLCFACADKEDNSKEKG